MLFSQVKRKEKKFRVIRIIYSYINNKIIILIVINFFTLKYV